MRACSVHRCPRSTPVFTPLEARNFGLTPVFQMFPRRSWLQWMPRSPISSPSANRAQTCWTHRSPRSARITVTALTLLSLCRTAGQRALSKALRVVDCTADPVTALPVSLPGRISMHPRCVRRMSASAAYRSRSDGSGTRWPPPRMIILWPFPLLQFDLPAAPVRLGRGGICPGVPA